MNGEEFKRRARRYARRSGLDWKFIPQRGKGSHGMFYVVDRFTFVQRGEISPRTLHSMMRDLGINRREF